MLHAEKRVDARQYVPVLAVPSLPLLCRLALLISDTALPPSHFVLALLSPTVALPGEPTGSRRQLDRPRSPMNRDDELTSPHEPDIWDMIVHSLDTVLVVSDKMCIEAIR